jgi:hypothetical protein
MSFNDIEPFRRALEEAPEGLITPSMASLLWVIVSYPNGCYIGQDALAKQARMKHDNYSKVLGRCTRLGLILREQSYARAGVRQCYRVNMTRLLELSRVELSTPTNNKRVELETVQGGTKSPSGGNQVHPYKDYKYYKSSKEDLFITSLSFIPANKRFAISEEVKKLLIELEHTGTTLEAIEADFRTVAWDLIQNPRVFVTGRLRDLVTRPVLYTSERQPPKCNNPDCDPTTRKLSYPIEIPNGNGARTYSCPDCNYSSVNKRNGY